MTLLAKAFTSIAFTISCFTGTTQECADGLGRPGHVAKMSVVNSYPGGMWSPTKQRYKGYLAYSRQPQRQMDMPLERCAILFFTGVGTGFLGESQDYWVGIPAVAVGVAMPFPGQSRNGRFKGNRAWKRKALGLFGMSVSYAVGLGIGANMKFDPHN